MPVRQFAGDPTQCFSKTKSPSSPAVPAPSRRRSGSGDLRPTRDRALDATPEVRRGRPDVARPRPRRALQRSRFDLSGAAARPAFAHHYQPAAPMCWRKPTAACVKSPFWPLVRRWHSHRPRAAPCRRSALLAATVNAGAFLIDGQSVFWDSRSALRAPERSEHCQAVTLASSACCRTRSCSPSAARSSFFAVLALGKSSSRSSFTWCSTAHASFDTRSSISGLAVPSD